VRVVGIPVSSVKTAEPTEMPFGADLQGLKKQCIRLAPSGKYDGSIYVVAATWPVAKITVTACTTGPLFQLLHIGQGPKR